MCGITGVISYSKVDETIIKKMTDVIHHRGPDSSGTYNYKNISFGHRRLAIQDLSKNGNQPMESQSSKSCIVFNGEIYNHLSLRKKITDYQFKGNSDTETILVFIEKYGIEKFLNEANGMFALAFFDKEKELLTLARDRAGEKPLYYGFINSDKVGDFVFASELKSIIQHPYFSKEINIDAVNSFFKYNYIGNELSIYKSIYKLLPGHYINFYINSKEIKKFKYFDINNIKVDESLRGESYETIKNLVHNTIRDAVKRQFNASDIAVGTFLSGGIDSSLITSILTDITDQKVNSYSIGFEDARYNEAPYAKTIANYLGTNHIEGYLTKKDILDIIPQLNEVYDEPFSDSSQIPTLLVSKFAKQHTTVVLSGDAGDELFGGYTRYLYADKYWNKLNKIPINIRQMVSYTIENNQKSLRKIFSQFNTSSIGEKFIKGSRYIGSETENDLYENLISHWNLNQVLKPEFVKIPQASLFSKQKNLIENFMNHDFKNYLPYDILTKVDRASMRYSLETRVPFLDSEVIKISQNIPTNFKINNGKTKIILKDILEDYLPAKFFDRPKMGFGIPLSKIISNDIRKYSDYIFSDETLNKSGILNTTEIQNVYKQHCNGTKENPYLLWDVIMFQQWYENNF